MRIVVISDTHGLHEGLAVPDGDILVHAGDLTRRGRLEDVAAFDGWLAALPHRHKVVIAGNHDLCFQRQPAESRALLEHALYLEDQEATVGGLRLYGSPWQPFFFDWAFQPRPGGSLRDKWRLVPTGVDVLVTHGPPRGIGDRTARGDAAGCPELSQELERVRPRVHLFGHIHEGYGLLERDGTLYVNASTCDLRYRASNPAVVVDLPAC